MSNKLFRHFCSMNGNLWNQVARSISVSAPMYKIAICDSALEAIKDIPNGAKILVGGFGTCGVPEKLINGLLQTKVKGLTIVSNNSGFETYGLGLLMKNHQIKRLILSFAGPNNEFDRQFSNGDLEVELIPQGTLAEKLRAGGAGIPAFYTRTGYGTMIHKGGVPIKFDKDKKTVTLASQPREHRAFDIGDCILEEAIVGDFALIKAWKADRDGNLTFRKTMRNFNPVMCRAAKNTIVEAEEIVEVGELGPDEIHVPGVYVKRLIKGTNYQKYTLPQPRTKLADVTQPGKDIRVRIAKRAAEECKDGMFVNLGVGIPLLCAHFIPTDVRVVLHGESGILGVGPYPDLDNIDPDVVNGGSETVTVLPGGSYLTSDDCFAMIRGGHLDLTILGAFQVSQYGDIASWMVPGKMMKGMGGAMDLVSAPDSRVVVTMEHTSKGAHKILPQCSLPLTGKGVVDSIITEKCVFEVDKERGLILTEIADGVSFEDIIETTGCTFQVKDNLKMLARSR